MRTSGSSGSRPSWCGLYVITLLGIALFGMVDVEMAAGAARTILEALAAVAVFGAMAAWVRSNRVALGLDRERDSVAARHPVAVAAGRQARRARVEVPIAGHPATRDGAGLRAGSPREVGTSR